MRKLVLDTALEFKSMRASTHTVEQSMSSMMKAKRLAADGDGGVEQPFPDIVMHAIGGVVVQAVDGRSLHAYLRNGENFTTWMRKRIRSYAFVQGIDFVTLLANTKKASRPSDEYVVTLDMAKQLGMVERNERGQAVRQYFLACERQLKLELSEKLVRLERERDPFHDIALTKRINERELEFARGLYIVLRDHMVPLIARDVGDKITACSDSSIKAILDGVDKRLGLDHKEHPTVERLAWHTANYTVKRLGGRAGRLPDEAGADEVSVIGSADEDFVTATEACWMVIDKAAVHPRLPGRISREITDYARTNRWPQGATTVRTMAGRPSPTFPTAHVQRWLDAKGRALITSENDRLHSHVTNVVPIRA